MFFFGNIIDYDQKAGIDRSIDQSRSQLKVKSQRHAIHTRSTDKKSKQDERRKKSRRHSDPISPVLMGCQRPILPVQPRILQSVVYRLRSFSFFWGSDRIAIESDPSLLWLLSGDFHAQLMFMTSDCVAAITHWKSQDRRGESGEEGRRLRETFGLSDRTRSRSIERPIAWGSLNHARNHLNENVAARKLATVFSSFFLRFEFMFIADIWHVKIKAWLMPQPIFTCSPLFTTRQDIENANRISHTAFKGGLFFCIFCVWVLRRKSA